MSLVNRARLWRLGLCVLAASLLGACASLQGTAVTEQAGSRGYWLERGEQWQGVKVAGVAPRSLDRICKARRCYPIKQTIVRPLSQLMQAYGLENLDYTALQKLAVDETGDEQIRLPDDLGQQIYRRAWHQHMREQDRDGLELMP